MANRSNIKIIVGAGATIIAALIPLIWNQWIKQKLSSLEKVYQIKDQFVLRCNSQGQTCDKIYEREIPTSGTIEIEYRVPSIPGSTHCSPIKVTFLLNGKQFYTSSILGWSNAPDEFSQWPLTTNLISAPEAPSGNNMIGIRATGEPFGCNKGRLSGWGGDVRIQYSLPD